MPRRKREDQIAMNHRKRARRHNQAADRGARKGRDGAFDFAGVAQVDRSDLHLERRCHGLDDAEQCGAAGVSGISQDRRSRHVRRNLLEHLQPFSAQAVFQRAEPGGVPPGCARLLTMPAPTGSTATGNTTGTALVT